MYAKELVNEIDREEFSEAVAGFLNKSPFEFEDEEENIDLIKEFLEPWDYYPDYVLVGFGILQKAWNYFRENIDEFHAYYHEQLREYEDADDIEEHRSI